MSPAVDPDLAVELALLGEGARFVIGCDEVGRGALAGPVSVGMAMVDASVGVHPEGLRDSKLLSQPRREALAPLCAEWACWSAVGQAEPEEVDAHGIMAALGIAGWRALSALRDAGAPVDRAIVLLDGNHDWLNPVLERPIPLTTRIKADQACASVAAASVIAKVNRDLLMIGFHEAEPVYGWAGNKGYGSAAHLAAIAEHGPSPRHRRTWLKSATA